MQFEKGLYCLQNFAAAKSNKETKFIASLSTVKDAIVESALKQAIFKTLKAKGYYVNHCGYSRTTKQPEFKRPPSHEGRQLFRVNSKMLAVGKTCSVNDTRPRKSIKKQIKDKGFAMAE